MKQSQYFIPTLKNNPQDAETKSHRLMLRAGLIRKLASGTYTYLPLGLKSLQKCTQIVREEMNRAGALELLMPAIHPADLWKETGRYDVLGDDMIHFKDRHGKLNVLGPTHEEIITDLARRELNSYKQLPALWYQIQTKFRDEMRPRAGVIRSREFCMKDAYSFHAKDACLDKTYESMKEAYRRIFKRCGLDFYIVQADPGAMGGSGSQEFVLFSDAGEDLMAQMGDTDLVVSAEMASRALRGLLPKEHAGGGFVEKHTPNASSIEAVATTLKAKPKQLVKTIFFDVSELDAEAKLIAVLVCGNHEVSEYKVKQLYPKARMASRDAIEGSGSAFGFSGPLGLKNDAISFFIDEDVLAMEKMIVGANKADTHLVGVRYADIQKAIGDRLTTGDYRQAMDGDEAVVNDQKVTIRIKTAIELGHIFKLNKRYSEPMKAHVLDESGKSIPLMMGCYGIGVNRMVASAIEQSSSDNGIVWPSTEIAPFQIHIITTHSDNAELMTESSKLYEACLKSGYDVLWDDRDVSTGIKFNDADLLGFRIRVTFGPKGLRNQCCEIKTPSAAKSQDIAIGEALAFISKNVHL